MVGNNLTYEPSFVTQQIQKDMSSLSIDKKCRVPIKNAFGSQKLNTFRKSTAKMNYQPNGHNISFDSHANNNSSFIGR